MNKKIRLILLATLTFLSFNILSAQKVPDLIMSQFFRIYKKSPQDAVDYAFGTNKWMIERNKDGIENVKTQLTNFLELIGNYCGYERIGEKNIGRNYKQINYMVKYDRQPIQFIFTFYKPKSEWQVQNFKYDDELDGELKEREL